MTAPGNAGADTIGQYMTTTGAVVELSTDSHRNVTVTASGLRPKVMDDIDGWCWFRVVAADDSFVGATNGAVLVQPDGTFTDTVGPLPSNGSYRAILECTPQNDSQLAAMTADPQNPVALFAMTEPATVPLTIDGISESKTPTSPHQPAADNLDWLRNTGNFVLCMGSVALLALPVALAGVIGGTSAALALAARMTRIPLAGATFKTLAGPCLKSVLGIDTPTVG